MDVKKKKERGKGKQRETKINENEGKSLNRRSKINYTKIHKKEGNLLIDGQISKRKTG